MVISLKLNCINFMFTRNKRVMTDERKDCKCVSKLREGRDLTRITTVLVLTLTLGS